MDEIESNQTSQLGYNIQDLITAIQTQYFHTHAPHHDNIKKRNPALIADSTIAPRTQSSNLINHPISPSIKSGTVIRYVSKPTLDINSNSHTLAGRQGSQVRFAYPILWICIYQARHIAAYGNGNGNGNGLIIIEHRLTWGMFGVGIHCNSKTKKTWNKGTYCEQSWKSHLLTVSKSFSCVQVQRHPWSDPDQSTQHPIHLIHLTQPTNQPTNQQKNTKSFSY